MMRNAYRILSLAKSGEITWERQKLDDSTEVDIKEKSVRGWTGLNCLSIRSSGKLL
jgi:hypothetical protein